MAEPRKDLIARAVDRLTEAVGEARIRLDDLDELDPDDRDRTVRMAVYLVARDQLDGYVREIVWMQQPFPEHEDFER